jgi:hypothetical protein
MRDFSDSRLTDAFSGAEMSKCSLSEVPTMLHGKLSFCTQLYLRTGGLRRGMTWVYILPDEAQFLHRISTRKIGGSVGSNTRQSSGHVNSSVFDRRHNRIKENNATPAMAASPESVMKAMICSLIKTAQENSSSWFLVAIFNMHLSKLA